MCGDVAKKNAVLEGGTGVEAVTEKNEDAAAEEKGSGTGEKKKKNEPVRDIREYTDEEFRQAYPEICTALIGKAKEGEIPPIKMLLEIIAGKYPDLATLKQRIGKTLGEMLLEELKRRQDAREAAADAVKAEESTRTNEASSEGAKSGGEAEDA
jgi:hypothetical protein